MRGPGDVVAVVGFAFVSARAGRLRGRTDPARPGYRRSPGSTTTATATSYDDTSGANQRFLAAGQSCVPVWAPNAPDRRVRRVFAVWSTPPPAGVPAPCTRVAPDDELGGGGGIGVSFDRSMREPDELGRHPMPESWSAGTRKLSDLSGKVTSSSVAGLPSGNARVKPGAKCLHRAPGQGARLGPSPPATVMPLSLPTARAHEPSLKPIEPVTVAPSETP